MLRECQLTLSLVVCLLLMQPFTSFAVEEFKVSEYGKGKQIWFEAEAFDERDSEDAYKLGKGEKAVDPADGAFGDIVTNTGRDGWILYRFDISRAGGKAGEWRFIGRLILSLKKMYRHGHGCGPVISDRMLARLTNYKMAKTL